MCAHQVSVTCESHFTQIHVPCHLAQTQPKWSHFGKNGRVILIFQVTFQGSYILADTIKYQACVKKTKNKMIFV